MKHKDVRNPRSWRQDPITKTKEEALAELQEYERRIRAGEDFAFLAAQVSDCGSAKRGGDLGSFRRGMMQSMRRMNCGAILGKLNTVDPICPAQSRLRMQPLHYKLGR